MALALPPQAHSIRTHSLLLSSSSFVAQLALRLASTGSGHRSESIDLLRIRVMMMALRGSSPARPGRHGPAASARPHMWPLRWQDSDSRPGPGPTPGPWASESAAGDAPDLT